MFDVLALGEAVVCYTYDGDTAGGDAIYVRGPGGAPVNVLATCAKFGLSCGFMGKVGNDENGIYFSKALRKHGVDISGMVITEETATTISYARVVDTECRLTFIRRPGADTTLEQDEIKTGVLHSAKIFHFGSVSLTNEPSRSATIKAARIAQAAGAVIAYDPNYRAALWKSVDEASKRMKGATFLADIIQISLIEMTMMTGKTNPEEAAQVLLEKGPKCVIITFGAGGALVATKEGMIKKEPPPCTPIDTTGAGDIFFGGFLYKLAKSGKALTEHSLADLESYIVFANAAASISVERHGAVASVPALDEVNERIK